MGKSKTMIIGATVLLLAIVLLSIVLLRGSAPMLQIKTPSQGETANAIPQTTAQLIPAFSKIRATESPAPVSSPEPSIQDATLVQAKKKFPKCQKIRSERRWLNI